VLSIVDWPPSTSYPRRLPSYARVVPATGSRASLSAAYLPQVQLGLTVLTRATVFRALPDIPLPVFEASIYLLPRGPAAPRFACPGPAVIRRATGFAACFETDLLRQ